MRPLHPVVEFDLPLRHGVGTLASVAGAGAAAGLLGWLAGPAPALGEGLRNVLGMLGVAALVPALFGARRDAPCRLRHDGEGWSLAVGRDEEPVWQRGELRVMFDLQSALLLRFVPTAGSGPWRTRWIATRGGDLGPRWHEWRCTVFGRAGSGRPTTAPTHGGSPG